MPLSNVSSGDPHVSAHNAERDAINDLEEAVALKISLPVAPALGDILRYDGTKWSTSPIRYFQGEGSPEGAVAGPIGSRYTDYSGHNGAVEWLKTGGADGNTGWLLVAGDTGWRNIAGLLSLRTNGVGHVAMLRRVGDFVDLYLDLTNPSNTSSPWSPLTLPAGFRPDFTRYGALQDNREQASQSTSVTSAGVVNLYTLTAGKRDRYQGQWSTTEAWPSSLPGVAL